VGSKMNKYVAGLTWKEKILVALIALLATWGFIDLLFMVFRMLI
jgi:hypothetical protein